jgi:hypothetical protein
MKDLFQKAATDPLSEAEGALKSWGIEYAKQTDGSILVPGNLDISGKGLAKLPNLASVKVSGYFYCHSNQLTSLEGAPQTVGGQFFCFDNHLTSLEGAPHAVGDDFLCNKNKLSSLEHAPQSVGGDFYCFDNQLTLLEHAPHTVAGDFACFNNTLTSLEHAPQQFKTLYSDLGTFASWDDVPEQLRLSPETREHQLQIAFSEGATVLNAPIKVSSPLRLKLRAP